MQHICSKQLENHYRGQQKTVDFLDITLDLTTKTYKPFSKPNNTPLYIHVDGNHPPSIIKNLPESNNRRLCSISSNQQVFDKVSEPYKKALRESGHQYKLEYKDVQTTSGKSNIDVATKVGKNFFRLIQNCFKPEHPLRPILNKNTIKLSYSCMPNVQQKISAKNKRILNQQEKIRHRECNCRKNTQRPMEGKCLTTGVIYQASVTTLNDNKVETYIIYTFKIRYNSHTRSWRYCNSSFY